VVDSRLFGIAGRFARLKSAHCGGVGCRYVIDACDGFVGKIQL
jgi:hypothetical protein